MFQANVVRVLIASPSDTADARRALRIAVEDETSLNAEAGKIALLPLLWERDSHPEMGDRPQGVVNRQLGDRSDMVIGTFWTRVGSPTSEADSGSVEEIERAIKEGKPVLLYFSQAPVAPENLDQAQWERLKDFKARMEQQGLYDTYTNLEELTRKVSAALTHVVRDRFNTELPPDQPLVQPHAQLVARVDFQPRVRDVGGRISQGTDYWLIIENVGNRAAEAVRFRVVDDGAQPEPGGFTPPDIFDADEPIPRLVPNSPLRFMLAVVMGTQSQFDLELTWEEDGETFTDVQTLRV